MRSANMFYVFFAAVILCYSNKAVFKWFSLTGCTDGQLKQCSTVFFSPSILQKMLKMPG